MKKIIFVMFFLIGGCSTYPNSYDYYGKNNRANEVVNFAMTLIGTPYKYGGSTPAEGFDCSGFVSYVYARHGVSLPRTSMQQRNSGYEVSIDSLMPGDLIFFNLPGVKSSHVGIYTGNNKFIHAPSSGKGVSESKLLGHPYWDDKIILIKRIF